MLKWWNTVTWKLILDTALKINCKKVNAQIRWPSPFDINNCFFYHSPCSNFRFECELYCMCLRMNYKTPHKCHPSESREAEWEITWTLKSDRHCFLFYRQCHGVWDRFQFSSVTQLYPTSCNPMDCSTSGLLSITISWSLLKLMSIESVMPSNRLILCHPLLLQLSIFPSIRVFSNESVLHIRWPKYCSFSSSISPSTEYSGLITFRMDWLDLLAVQGALKSLLQHHSSKALILWHSAFFIVQLSDWW